MIKTPKENMNQVILNQRRMNKLISKAIGSDEDTAFMYGSQVRRRLTIPVSDSLLVSLATLCHKIGIDAFSKSTALHIVNNNARKWLVKKCIRTMLSNSLSDKAA